MDFDFNELCDNENNFKVSTLFSSAFGGSLILYGIWESVTCHIQKPSTWSFKKIKWNYTVSDKVGVWFHWTGMSIPHILEWPSWLVKLTTTKSLRLDLKKGTSTGKPTDIAEPEAISSDARAKISSGMLSEPGVWLLITLSAGHHSKTRLLRSKDASGTRR